MKPDGLEGHVEADDPWEMLKSAACRAIEQAGGGPATAQVEVRSEGGREWATLTLVSSAGDPPDGLDFATAADAAVEELVSDPQRLPPGFTDHPGLGSDQLREGDRPVAVRVLSRSMNGTPQN